MNKGDAIHNLSIVSVKPSSRSYTASLSVSAFKHRYLCQHHWMTIPKFWPQPILRLFLRYQIFRNRNRDFFPRPNFSETETDTFLPRPNFPKPKPRLFSETNFFRNRYFFPETKFSETETETFFLRPNFPKPKPRLFSETKFSKTDTETLQKLVKVPRPRPKPRILNILDKFRRDILQIFPPSLFFFSSRKTIFSFYEYFPPFSSSFFFSSGIERQCERSSLCFPPCNR